ncbi:MAG: hypothetical protein KDA47_09900, partial [Planctomycetales bacterium]|nr:hypothetical protein [Planctomycetales bacterium]
DGTAFFAVGKASGANGAIDLDAFGFGPNDLFRFVRLTDDASQGSSTGLTVGADIDAIGAISSYVSPTFNAGGQGILVADNASPTILNNLLINNETGIEIDATSSAAGAVVGGTIYQHNTTDANTSIGLGDFPLVLGDAERLFVDPVAGNYYLADGARAIDSAIDSMQDRPALVSVKTPLGLPATPVLAPNTDLTGQLRVDDPRVETPSGVGERVFKDRGALDRSDFVGPTGQLTTPRDNDGAGQDRNPNMNVVELSSQVLNNFTIQLIDGIGPVDPNDGIGAADNTVTRNSVVLYRGTNEDNLQPLVEGVDYRFHYDSTNNSIVLTPLSGIWQSDQLYRVELAGEQRFVLVAPSGTQVRDGSTFSVADQSGETVTFEIERGYTLTLPTATSVTDQETFTIDDGTKVVTFEFDSDSSYDTNNRQVVFDPLNPLSSATTALINAIVSANLGLTPTDLGSGVIHLGGTRLHNVDVTGSSLTLSGSPGVSQLPFGIQIPSVAGLPSGLQDQQTFSITNGALTVVFELDTNGSVSSGHRQVRFFTTSTVDGVANAIVNAIAGAGLALSPVNLGGGLVGLGGNAGILLDTGTTGLTQTGTAGVDASVAVPITGDVSNANVVAQQMAAAINSASVLLSGVSALAVGDQVLLDGASAVSGSSAISVPSIKDLAGNPLKSNQPDGSTTFDIFLGSGLDFGDAPDGPYDSKLANNGPRHQIVDGFFLGSGVTVDVDGPGPDQADSDRQDDGIVFMSNFVRGYNSQFTVSVAGGPGVVDAWIDFNQDGDFDDAGEQILSGVTLAEGTHQLELRNRNPLASDIQDRGEVPGSAELGTTYARFRLSSNGVSGPNGAAADGEVEDYQIDIFANDYQNRSNALDVNADGFVSPIDALLVINFLNASSAGQLPQNRPTPGPPFWDVNGDGQISPIDVGQVITYLNDVNNGSGEGDATLLAEGESTVSTLQAADLSNGLATLAMPQEIIAGMTQRWEATNSVAVTGSSTSQQDESDETPASVGIASNGNQANSAALDPTALALADLDDVLSEIAEDIEGSQVSRDAHDDFFANIHF